MSAAMTEVRARAAPERAAVLHSIGHSRPIYRELSTLESASGPRAIGAITADGGARFVQRHASVATLAAEAIAETIASSRLSTEAIDAVIMATESLWDVDARAGHSYDALREDFFAIVLAPFGLQHAAIYGTWMSGCCNLTSSLSLARALIVAGQHSHVLVVVADRQAPTQTRMLGDGLGVTSDVAAAFLVSSADRDGYLVRHVVSHSTLSAARGGSSGIWDSTVALRAAARQLRRKVRSVCATSLGDYETALPDNVHSAVAELVCGGLGIPPHRMSFPAKEEFGHAFAADTILALSRVERVRSNDRIALINIGPWSLGVTLLQRCEGPGAQEAATAGEFDGEANRSVVYSGE